MNTMQWRVQETIDELVASGAERGVQVAVYRHGELVVDAVAGLADPVTARPMGSDTVIYGWSAGKAVTATVAHLLVERGLFGYDTPIVELWPEFGVHGKERATVRHALTHTVGVPGLPAETTPEDLCDWECMCATIADAVPWWEPGTATGYHAYTFGYILGEVVRRAMGKPISQLLREEVALPLGIADELYFGMPATEHGRLARLEDEPGSEEFFATLPGDSPFLKWGPVATMPTAALGNRTDVLAADIPAGAKMTARALARMYAALLGEVDGVRLLSPARLREATAVAFSGDDQIFGEPTRWTLGFAPGRPGADPAEPTTAFGMAGAGGSYGYADPGTGIAVAVLKNRLGSDFAAAERVAAIVSEAAATEPATTR